MIRGLIRLRSSLSAGHSIWWPRVPGAFSYVVYRSKDVRGNWERLANIPGQYFQDVSKLQTVHFVVPSQAWIDAGEYGQKCLRLPDVPYSMVQKGRPVVASSRDDVQIKISYSATDASQVQIVRPGMVSGMDQTVFLSLGNSLPTGGAVSEFPIINFETAVTFTVIYQKLVNYVDIQTNMYRTFYCVVPVTIKGEEHLPGAPGCEVVDTLQVDTMDYIQAEMVRRNGWLFDQNFEPTQLLIRRTAGKACHCTDSVSGLAKARTGCPACYETGIIGGYYGPFDFGWVDGNEGVVRTIDEGGQKVERRSRSYVSPDPMIQDGDLIVRKNGERLIISGVVQVMQRGVLLQQEYDAALLNPLDSRYLIPLYEPEDPIIYNPVYGHMPGDGAEPVFQADTVHGRDVENKGLLPGRTVTFGRIQAPSSWKDKGVF